MRRMKRKMALLLAAVFMISSCVFNGNMIASANIEECDTLREDAIEHVVDLFESLPSAEDIKSMTPEEMDGVMQQVTEAMDAFDALSDEECNYFVENYPQLYNKVMVELAGVLSSVKQNEMEPMSLLPLEEVEAQLVLSDLEGVVDDFSKVPIKVLFHYLMDKDGNFIDVDLDSATTAWRYIKDGEDGLESYEAYEINDETTINLTRTDGLSTYNLELIVGNGGPLNGENVRYIITVYLSEEVSSLITYELYTQTEDGQRIEVVPKDIILDGSRTYWVPEHIEGTEYYLGINSTMDNHPYIDMKVYLTSLSGNQTDITDQILNQDMTKRDAGYKGTLDKATLDTILDTKYFRIVLTNTTDGSVLYDEMKIIDVASDVAYVEGEMLSYDDGNKTDVTMWESSNLYLETEGEYVDGIHTKQYMLKKDCSTDNEYYYALSAHSPIWEGDANRYVAKAVVGLCESWDEAASLEDIQDLLIPEQGSKTGQTYGYKANYNKEDGGQYFTVFFKKVGYEDATEFSNKNVDIWRFHVSVIEYNSQLDTDYVREFTEKPIIGEADPWLRVTGATDKNGKEYDSYVIENGKNINMDTYYGYGYQTIFINDASADLSNLKPAFWYANTKRVYAVSKDTGGRVEENHTRDFNEENQQYAGVIIGKDGNENERNYWVTFKKLNHNGPELYVFGPNEREVILDEYFEFKHDILIANIGNKPLEDISVELFDAENVKLDPYWTVGGDGNNTLAAFTTTSSDTQYGELSNLAKIRLLPDGDGEVRGTLIIRAKNQEPVMITLNGTAQNPEIVTETLDNAIKYVPYQHIIATNNMHDWVETKFSVSEGSLPEGISLNEDTGEIYGVPTVPDENTETTYTFTVRADYFAEGQEGYFNPSYKEFSLTVKPNTDENVYEASDKNDTSSDLNDGYTIKQHIGMKTGNYSFELENIEDTVFTSYGHYDEFVALWLNGEKLAEGVDYDSESGSTKITIKSQTFENKTDRDGTNTIAMEFRKDNDGDGKGDNGAEMNRTSQNFTVKNEPSQADQDKVAASHVVSLISAIPSTITLNERQMINDARTAYNALTPSQQKLVTNYDKLTRAEVAIKQLEQNAQDKAAADKVVNMIESLPSPITIDNKDAVNAVRNAYNMLTAAQKRYVINYAKLQAAESSISEDENYEEVQYVTFVGVLVDKNGQAFADKIVEIHSVVQIGRTDENGSFQFNNVGFGNHTIFVKDENGRNIAQKEFDIQAGSFLSMSDSKIVAENGSVFTVRMQLDGDKLTFLNIEEGNKAPTVNTNKNSDCIDIGSEATSNYGGNSPQTGEHTNLPFWFILLTDSLVGLVIMGYMIIRKRKYVGK